MVDSVTFGVSTLGTVLGLLILLVGVQQTSGQSINALVAAGGVVALAAIAVLTVGVIRLDEAHAAE